MKDKMLLEKEKLVFDNFIKEKEIDEENKTIKYIKEKKKLWIFLASSFFIIILAIINISGMTGYSGETSLDEDVVKVLSSGENSIFTVELRSDGKVAAFGDNGYGQCNVGNWTDIIDVSVGENHTVGLRADGKVAAVGDNKYGQCDVDSWEDIKSITAYSNYTEGIKSNGEVVWTGNK